METAVRKATRLEYRPPKEKHLLSKAFSAYNIINAVINQCNSIKKSDIAESSLHRWYNYITRKKTERAFMDCKVFSYDIKCTMY